MAATETSPLLNDSLNRDGLECLPSVDEGLALAQTRGILSFNWSEQCPTTLSNSPAQTAYGLLILSQWRVVAESKAPRIKDVWERVKLHASLSSDLAALDHAIDSLWADFTSEYRTMQDIQRVLWMLFPVKRGSHVSLRVADCLLHSLARLLSDGLIESVVQKTWDYGMPSTGVQSPVSSSGVIERYDKLGTPRVLHLLDVVGDMLLLSVLVNYLLYPPFESIIKGDYRFNGRREYFLTWWPVALLARPWTWKNAPALLVLLAILFTLPATPLPEDSSFMLLHLALALQILLLHFPLPPSPLFLLPPHETLPLSLLLTHSMSRLFFPILLFFLPVLLLSAALLSSSLADTTFRLALLSMTDAPPMQTRTVFLFLGALVILLLLLSLVMGAAKFPVLSTTDESKSPDGTRWDRFSKRIGLDARRALVSSLLRYTPKDSYYFPPPLNILQVLLVRLPGLMVFVFWGSKPSPILKTVERALWRATVGPVVCVTAALWLWGLWT